MRVAAVLQADLNTTPLGTRSRLADEVAGVPVLRRTVERLSAAVELDSIHVICPPEQSMACAELLHGMDVDIRPSDASPSPWGGLVQAARKWSLDGWRGGVGGTTYFDEFTDCRRIAALSEQVAADAVLSVPPAAALIDPQLADRMIGHRRTRSDDIRLVFTQAPPGLAGVLLDMALVRELAEKNIPIGWVFSYKPDSPQKDLVFQPCCLQLPVEVRHATGRLTCDTRRSTERVAALLADHPAPDLVAMGRWLQRHEDVAVGFLPREVELELTTDDPFPHTLLRPRGLRVPPRGPVDPALVERLVSELIAYDDSLVILGGFGDPLRHPRFGEMTQRIGSVRVDGVGLYGLSVRTTGVELDEAGADALRLAGVDVVEVVLDAWTGPLYARLHSPSDPALANLDLVTENVDRLVERRQAHQAVRPIVVPSFTKARENVHELDDFHDGWLRKIGAVAIHGYCHHAAQLEDRAVINMAPSSREACRRLPHRCLVLADGRVVLCDQDFAGTCVLGDLTGQSLEEIWRGAERENACSAHRERRWAELKLCGPCDEWHRP